VEEAWWENCRLIPEVWVDCEVVCGLILILTVGVWCVTAPKCYNQAENLALQMSNMTHYLKYYQSFPISVIEQLISKIHVVNLSSDHLKTLPCFCAQW
jgi:hypothetical protein